MAAQHRKLALRVMPLLIASAYASGAFAQEKLEEVVITAQKRKENLQEVPFSVSAISGAQLELRGIDGARDLNAIAPNVVVKTAAPGSGLIAATSIRGMNSGQPAIWADPSIGIYIDGVFVGKNQGALFDVVDLERVEVLRGPQGTLFGRNTEGGAINLISRKPSGEFSGAVSVDVGNYRLNSERISLDLPKFGALKVSVAAKDEKRNGTVNNPAGTGDWGNRNRQSGRLAATLDVSPKLKFDYAYDYTHINETPTAVSLLSSTGYAALYPQSAGYSTYLLFQNGMNMYPAAYFAGACPGANPLACLAGLRNANLLVGLGSLIAPYTQAGYPGSLTTDPGRAYYNKLQVDGQSLTGTYELNNSNTLKYIGAYRKMHYQDSTDLDGTPVSIYNQHKDTHYESTSHEFQLIGSVDRLNYVAGVYLFKEDGNTFSFQDGAFFTFLPPAYGGVAYRQPWYRVQTDAKAVFAQFDYKVTNDLTATLGLRNTKEEKNVEFWRSNTNKNFDLPGAAGVTYQAGFTPTAASASWTASTPVLALAYKLRDGLNVYGRIAKGFKSGGFPLEAASAAAVLAPYAPEKSTSYEAGVKSSMLGGKLNVNATVFKTDINDWHVSQLPVGGTTPTIVNAGKAENKGLELEVAYQIADGWRVQGSYGYLDAKFKEFMQLNPVGTMVDTAANTQLGYAPKNQLTLNVDGRLAKTSMGTLRLVADYIYSAEYYNYAGQNTAVGTNVSVGNSAEESKMPAIGMVNARLVLSGLPFVGGPGKAEASLWVRNLTDVKKENAHIDVGGFYRVAGYTEPRTFGLNLNYKW